MPSSATRTARNATGSVRWVDRHRLAVTPTPLQPADRLGSELGFEPAMLWVKRDDLTGLAGGGNKVRKLEYLLADATRQGCDVLVTAGAVQSNHARTTAAAACAAGLGCVLVLRGDPHDPALPDGNVVLDELFGAEIDWVDSDDPADAERQLAETCVRLAGQGRRPYEIPLGGASAVGTLGYVRAAAELASQAPIGSLVYTVTGTGGTHAGLVVGLGPHHRVRGDDVGALDDVVARMDELIPAVAALAGLPQPRGALQLDRTRIGDGYGQSSPASLEAIGLAARLEALVVDPVYGAKALAGLIADRRSGRLPPDKPVVFLHTGGLPSVFAHAHAREVAGAGGGTRTLTSFDTRS